MGGGEREVSPPNRINEQERPSIRASRFNMLSMQRYRSEFGVHLPES
ncbi:hypothetical protein [Halorubrum trueperi]|uniref:Uncharacterized protein n=1 Tax=Halorubrum trueperi TaxID=2004704 RepID=A0ABD5UQ63_9EURY